MPKRSKVDTLPPQLKAWLDAELVKRGFADYVELAADLKAKGADLSKSSLHRYGSKFEERMAQLKVSTEQARAVVAASPDDEGAMNEALIRLTQDKLFGVLVELDVDPQSVNLSKLTKSIADLARSSITQKKWQIEVRTKAAERMKAVEQEAKAMKGETRDVALAMLEKVRKVYEGAM
jgi:hypothetical protein